MAVLYLLAIQHAWMANFFMWFPYAKPAAIH
jgi:hypothetical protein